MDQGKLFVRTTTVSETDKGVQASKINVFIYDTEEMAHKAYEQLFDEEAWHFLLESGEAFMELEEDGYTNTFFVEVRKVQGDPRLSMYQG